MKHARSDYDPIQDPRPDGIPEDEPVFLLRAQDQLAPEVVRGWAYEAQEAGLPDEVVDGVFAHAHLMEEWQQEHGSKLPDVPEGAMRA